MKAPGLVLALVALLVIGFAAYTAVHRVAGQGSGVDEERVLRVLLPAIAKKPWEEIVAGFERETGVRVEAAYGSTGWILAQLKLKRPVDVVAMASIEDMEKAVKMGLVDPESVRVVACTVPAIIVPRGNPAGIRSLEDLAKPGVRIAIADPESVVVGRYAVKLLEYNHLWSRVKRNIVAYARNFADLVNMLLAARGEIDAIIAFHVAHYWYPNETELIMLPRDKVPCATCITIGYVPGGDRDLAERFIEYVLTKGLGVLRRYHYMSEDEALRHALRIGGC